MDTSTPQKATRFDNSFTPQVDIYIERCKTENQNITIAGYATFIGTDEASVWAWATKHTKDDKGNTTQQLARPKFFDAIQKLKKIQEASIPDDKLNVKQELFCKIYTTDREFFGNGVESYVAAYDIDLSQKGAYAGARASASRLLSSANILKRINELLELGNLNDAFVDKQLEFVITQNVDFGSKVAAIREYNKLKARITEKIDHTTKGKEMPTPIYGGKSNTTI